MMELKKENLMGIIHASVWGLLMLLGFSALTNFYDTYTSALHILINTALLMVLFYAHLALVNHFFEKKRFSMFFCWSFLVFLFTGILRVFINIELLIKPDFDASNQIITPLWRIGALVFFTSGFVWLFAISYQLLMNRFKKERENLALINQQQTAQLQYLKAQINPHFLFNALNNIYSLTMVKSNEAPKMLLTLSDILRYAIYDGQRDTVALKQEVENMDKFIALFQMKSEHPLSIKFKKQGNFNDMSIEPMIFIPLVENCFKHCDFEINEKAFIDIALEVEKGALFFTTRNTYNAANTQKDKVGGVGLENIKQRLALRYKDNFDMRFSKQGDVFEVRLRITNSTLTL
jgi:two-component system, LytTR family, sensor kinase